MLYDRYWVKGINFYHLLPLETERAADPDIKKKTALAERANLLARGLGARS
jgi:hypothetical protein